MPVDAIFQKRIGKYVHLDVASFDGINGRDIDIVQVVQSPTAVSGDLQRVKRREGRRFRPVAAKFARGW